MKPTTLSRLDVDELPHSIQLKRTFLEHLSASLTQARVRAGQTRREAATRAGLPEHVIDQLEDQSAATLTIDQIVEVALAYGTVPLDIMLAAQTEVQEFARQMPQKARTPPEFEAWRARTQVRRALAMANDSAPR